MLAYAQSVLDLAEEQLREVEQLHDAAKTTGVVRGRMQALIKNVVENQRSPLDYVAQAVADAYCPPGTNPYWPAAKKPSDFTKRIEEELPGLLTSQSKIADSFRRHQPYQRDHDWLWHLIDLTRENKHHRLTAQARIEQIVPLPVRAGPGPKGVTTIILGRERPQALKRGR